MNCLSLLQPWATAIELNLKTIETRSWAAPKSAIGKPLAIAASKNLEKKGRAKWAELMKIPAIREAFRARNYFALEDLPLGQVVATTVLDGCFSTNGEPPMSHLPSSVEYLLGDFSINRWAWTLSAIQRLAEPTPVVGRFGIYQWERKTEETARW
jgi:hypothetical protein